MANPDNIKGQGFHTNPERMNLKGRPKGALSRKTLLRKWLEVSGTNGTVEDDVALALIKKALEGDVNAIKEVLDSTHGKVTDKLEQTGANGEPLAVKVTFGK